MPLPEDPLESLESTLNKAYSDMKRELVVTQGYAEDAVKRLVTQKTTLDEHSRILNDQATRLDRIEAMLTQVLAHLKEMPSVAASEPEAEHSNSDPPPLKRERTFWERAFGIFPDEATSEKP